MSRTTLKRTANGNIVFSDEVEQALQQILPSKDPFDQANFDAVGFVNERFPDEKSLSDLPRYISDLQRKLSDTEGELLDAVRVQATTASTAAKDLENARHSVLSLHRRVSDIKAKAEDSEKMVHGICESIRHLDTAKRNLSDSVKTIKNLQLYILAVQGLDKAFADKDYSKCNDHLRSALGYASKFEPYKDIPKIRELKDRLGNLMKRLEFHLQNEVVGDLRPSASGSVGRGAGQAHGSAPPAQSQPQGTQSAHGVYTEDTLREACLIVDALGPDVAKKVVQRFITTQLETYGTLFRRGTEDARLEKTERRFVFIRQLLDNNERLFRVVFPVSWCVPQELCVEFCLRTNKDLSHQLQEETGNIDVAVLVYVLRKTIEVEKDLTQRMKWYRREAEQKASSEASVSPSPARASSLTSDMVNRLPEYKYYRMIVQCFDSYMPQYIRNEDDTMAKTVEMQLRNESIAEDLLVLQSAQDIFLFVQESLRRATTFAHAATLCDLAGVWLKHLQNYSRQLLASAQKPPTTLDDEKRFCLIVNSADYCRAAAAGLCEDLTKIVSNDGHELEGAELVTEQFETLFSTATLRLVDGLLDQIMNSMAPDYQAHLASNAVASSVAHATTEALDESPFVGQVRRFLQERFENCARTMHAQCFQYFCSKMASAFVPRFSKVVYKPKVKHGDLAVSQLRIDCTALERALLQLPGNALKTVAHESTSMTRGGGGGGGGLMAAGHHGGGGSGGSGGQAASSSGVLLTVYTKTIHREFQRLNAALKVLQCPPGDTFVEMYYSLVQESDRSIQDLCRLLDLKGVSQEDMRQYAAILKRKKDVPDRTKRDLLIEGAWFLNEGGAAAARGNATSSGPSGVIPSGHHDMAGSSAVAADASVTDRLKAKLQQVKESSSIVDRFKRFGRGNDEN